jgi:heterogeneous nuclear ribonucleoprotein U-like protein 1
MCIFLICRSPSPANQKEVAENEPEIEECLVLLDTYNSDLNLTIDAKDFVSGAPLTDAGFAYMFAGARANYGFVNGKVYYEVKVQIIYFEKFDYRCTTICFQVTENLAISNLEESMPNRHIIRVGWSVDSTTYQLGKSKIYCCCHVSVVTKYFLY